MILGFLVWLLSRSNRRIPQRQVLVALLSFLAFYDWLTVTGRLYHLARIIFALGAAVASGRWFAAHEQKSMQFCRRSLPFLLGLYVAAFVAIEGGGWWSERAATARLPEAVPGTPNVLVIVIDTLRADHVSSYGYSRPTTPNLDRLAGEGVLFENAIAPSSWSLPSHVSLVTGRYLHDHKVGNVQPEPWLGWGKAGLGGFLTIGEALEEKGYRTAAFSANRTYFSHNLGFGRAFIHFEDYFNSVADCFVRTLYGREFARIYLIRSEKSLVKRILRKLGWTSLLDQDAEGSGSYGGAFGIRKHSDEVNRELLNWIGGGSNHPFFAMLNYFDVHDPYGGPSSYPKPAWSQSTDIDRYDDGVKYVDDCLGRLMRALEEKGLSKNTLVIVTSDHGEALGQHFLMRHGHVLYWELIRVPLVV
ncbi:MAG TPA: sulfatase [Terriglobales bacterium]|nr:sulfatase [Terriglobales bacterium]